MCLCPSNYIRAALKGFLSGLSMALFVMGAMTFFQGPFCHGHFIAMAPMACFPAEPLKMGIVHIPTGCTSPLVALEYASPLVAHPHQIKHKPIGLVQTSKYLLDCTNSYWFDAYIPIPMPILEDLYKSMAA